MSIVRKTVVAVTLGAAAALASVGVMSHSGHASAAPAAVHVAAPASAGFTSTCIGTVCTSSGHWVDPKLPTTHLVTPDPVSHRVLVARGPSCWYWIGTGPAVNCQP